VAVIVRGEVGLMSYFFSYKRMAYVVRFGSRSALNSEMVKSRSQLSESLALGTLAFF
jgi:hypothetical protein